jgi:GNAT superfamily N-acetyltransferase
MDAEYSITYVEHPEESAWGVIGQGINEYNAAQAGDDRSQRLCYALQAPDGAIAGGVIGVVYWDWLYVDLMWLPEALRGRGYGHRLLELLEEEAAQRGARHAFLDTFSFQAPGFYQSHGYRVFGELPGFPAGHTRYFLTKELA